MLSESVVSTTQKLASATDTGPPPASGGYEASFHGRIAGVVLVHAPCGCRLAIGSDGETLLTLCLRDECVFEWQEAISAYGLLAKGPIRGISVVAPAEPGGEVAEAEVPE